MLKRTDFYLQSIKEFFYPCMIMIMISILIPDESMKLLYDTLIYLLARIPLNIITILLWNFLNAIIIFLLSMIKREWVSFFITLNGFALGLMIGRYQYNIGLLISLLFPHAFFETTAIIILCSEFKIISFYRKTQNIGIIRQAWNIIIFICFPLFLFAALIEGLRFYH